jgi:AraC-like DNA-binding protein/quercetin dioxygenase-like cupin family protein
MSQRKQPTLGSLAARPPWLPAQALAFPADLVQPVQDETYVAYYRPTPKPFVFLHSSHLPAGTVTGDHRHPCVALHGSLQGTLLLCTKTEELALDAGVFCLLPPGTMHHWRSEGPHTAANFSLLIDHRQPKPWPGPSGVKEMCDILIRRVRTVQRFNASNDAELKDLFWKVVDHLMADRPRPQAVITGLLLALLGRVTELLGESPDAPAVQVEAAERIRRLLLARVADRLTIDQVARSVHMSPTRAKEMFRAAYGCGIMAYFNQLKIWQAKRLLSASSLTIEQVSRQLGFSTPAYFSRVFLQHTGESPTVFRSQSREL